MEILIEGCDLSSCPFCGYDMIKLIKPYNSSLKYVVCENCDATGPKSINIEDAVKLWNRWSI